MGLLLWPEVLIALILVAVLARVRTHARLYLSEESAHAAALDRRSSGTKRTSSSGTVLILGAEESEAPCRLIKVSRSSIRIQWSRALPPHAQLQVEHGDDCFVCEVRNVDPRDEGYILDLKVLASNYRPPSPRSPLWGLCGSALQRLWRK